MGCLYYGIFLDIRKYFEKLVFEISRVDYLLYPRKLCLGGGILF